MWSQRINVRDMLSVIERPRSLGSFTGSNFDGVKNASSLLTMGRFKLRIQVKLSRSGHDRRIFSRSRTDGGITGTTMSVSSSTRRALYRVESHGKWEPLQRIMSNRGNASFVRCRFARVSEKSNASPMVASSEQKNREVLKPPHLGKHWGDESPMLTSGVCRELI